MRRIEIAGVLAARSLDLLLDVVELGQELVQRRVEQPDRHRQAVHRFEDRFEVALLERQQGLERGLSLLVARRRG